LRPGEPIPCFGEHNPVVYVLGKKQGATLDVPDGSGSPRQLRIDGLLQDSVFQNGLLIAGERFVQLYPSREGFTFFLIQTPAGREMEAKRILDRGLSGWGFEATP